jgi:hypothetical protein
VVERKSECGEWEIRRTGEGSPVTTYISLGLSMCSFGKLRGARGAPLASLYDKRLSFVKANHVSRMVHGVFDSVDCMRSGDGAAGIVLLVSRRRWIPRKYRQNNVKIFQDI